MQPWGITTLRGQKGEGAKQREGRRERRENSWETKEGKRILRKEMVSSRKAR